MKRILRVLLPVLAAAALSPVAAAKDQPITVAECPAPVQAVIRHYSTQGTLESVAKDEKKKTGGPVVYEAKFSLKNGKRTEVHISAEGKVIQFEEKKPKS
jgi:hypothetical protein